MSEYRKDDLQAAFLALEVLSQLDPVYSKYQLSDQDKDKIMTDEDRDAVVDYAIRLNKWLHHYLC